MNIMFVASDNYRYSGAFLSMVRLATILNEKYGHNILVVLPYAREKSDVDGRRLLTENGIRSVVIRSYTWTIAKKNMRRPKSVIKTALQLGYNSMFAVPAIKKLVQQEHIDLVHLNTSWGYVGAPAALRTKIPFVWHIREFLEEDQLRRILFRKHGYRLMKKSNRVIAISQSIYQKYAMLLGKENLSLIMNGIPSEGFYEKRTLFQNDIIQLVLVGGLYKHKRQIIAIRACLELIKRGYTHFHLSIVGQGDTKESLQNTIDEAGAGQYIELCGSTSDTASYYHRADIALMCSNAEAFGRVTVEAMISGCLMIGADNAGTVELVQDGITGLLYHCDDVQDLADKLEYALCHHEEMRNIAANGQTYMMENMTAEINADHVNALYEEILKK